MNIVNPPRAFLSPLVFNGYQGGFMCVNKAEHEKIYLDPIRSNLILVFPDTRDNPQSAYDALVSLTNASKAQITSTLMSCMDSVVCVYGRGNKPSTFTLFYSASVRRFVKFEEAAFKSLQARIIRGHLRDENRYKENPVSKEERETCIFVMNGFWEQYLPSLWTP